MFAKIPGIFEHLYPHRMWRGPVKNQTVYLTFDDGPIPEVTPWVLDQLKLHNAKATFFCIGDNIRKNPDLFQKILAQGHRIGNHTYHHLNGWRTSTKSYLDNVQKTEDIIKLNLPEGKEAEKLLFRPPYGKITGTQARLLRQRNYELVMWNVLSMDYNPGTRGDKCYQNVIKNTVSGSIIVFHDSLKAEKNLRKVLPQVLEYFYKEGFSFEAL